MSLFACPLDSTASSAPNPSSSSPTSRPAPRLSEFIAYALHRTRLPLAVTHQALFLLRRLKSRFPAARGSSGHRLFISALMLASKSTCDDTYSNKSWTIVGQGLFSLREVNQMERELFGYLGFKVNVENEELSEFVEGLEHGRIQTSTVIPPASVTSPALQTPEVIPSIVHSPMEESSSFGSTTSSQSSLPSISPSPYHHHHHNHHQHRSSISSDYRAPIHQPSLSSRASIAGYPASSHAIAAAQAMANLNSNGQLRPSTSHPASISAPSLHANKNESNRPTSSHSYDYNGQRSYEASTDGYYTSPSPSSSMSSSSLSSCGSLSHSSSSMSSCATPSSHSTPDTPPNEFENSPWGNEKHLDGEDVEDADESQYLNQVRGQEYGRFRYNVNGDYNGNQEKIRNHGGYENQTAHPYGNWQ